jgi:hypothetical protein
LLSTLAALLILFRADCGSCALIFIIQRNFLTHNMTLHGERHAPCDFLSQSLVYSTLIVTNLP